MTLSPPRFNQEFVRSLEDGSPEARFVSAVGDYTFLGRLHADKIAEAEIELRHPITFNLFESQEAYETYVAAYAANFELILENDGLGELVFALNSLKVSIDELRSRRISWVESTFTPGNHHSFNQSYIVGSEVGFSYRSISNPSLNIVVSDENDEHDKYIASLPYMWDINIQ